MIKNATLYIRQIYKKDKCKNEQTRGQTDIKKDTGTSDGLNT
jgi:hypothetical protein